MTWKTLSVHEEFYDRVKDKQLELIGKHKVDVLLSYVTETALLIGIDNVELPCEIDKVESGENLDN